MGQSRWRESLMVFSYADISQLTTSILLWILMVGPFEEFASDAPDRSCLECQWFRLDIKDESIGGVHYKPTGRTKSKIYCITICSQEFSFAWYQYSEIDYPVAQTRPVHPLFIIRFDEISAHKKPPAWTGGFIVNCLSVYLLMIISLPSNSPFLVLMRNV
jgi:hypothetical protein